MIQGDAYNIELNITNQGELLDVDQVDTVEVMLGGLRRVYPENIRYSDGKFLFPVTQEETFQLPSSCLMQVRVKFKSGDVIGSPFQKICVATSLSRVVL
jgi:hypothetical protein